MKKLKKDKLLDRWYDEKIVELNKISEIDSENILKIDSILHNQLSDYFYKILISTLIQLNLNILFLNEDRKIKFIIKEGNLQLVHKNLDYFPPLFFIPYENSNKLRINDYPLNYNHKFSKWLVENTEKLIKSYNSFFYSIRDNIYKPRWNIKSNEIIEPINNLLNRLETLDKTFFDEYPKEEILLKEEDFD